MNSARMGQLYIIRSSLTDVRLSYLYYWERTMLKMDSFALSVITEPIAVNMISLCERDFLEAEKALWGRTLAIWNTVTITAGMIILGIYGISARFRIYLIPSGIVCVLTIGLLIFCICYSIFPQWIGGLRYRNFKSNNGDLRLRCSWI